MKRVNFILSGLRKRSVLAIGVFDGVHRGHQVLLKRGKEVAKKQGTIFAVLTFSPHPEEILKGEREFLIFGEEERKNKLLEFGVDVVITQKIDFSFLSLEPTEFVEEIADFYPGWVVVGKDFYFGKGRKGDYKLMKQMGKKLGFKLIPVPLYQVNGEKVSSSLIRKALIEGDFKRAEELLGFPYYLRSKVEKRKGLASEVLGYPTANLSIDQRIFRLSRGVYLAQASFQNRKWKALVYYGTSPTLKINQESLEVHLLNFKGEIKRGEVLIVEFLCKLRDEISFSSLQELKKRVQEDIEAAKKINI